MSGAKKDKNEHRQTPIRVAHKALTRQRLLDGATEVFSVKGYLTTTVEDIVSAAGTTRATFYLHFGSKAVLAEDLLAHVRSEMAYLFDSLPEVIRSLTRDAIRSWIMEAMDCWELMRPQLEAVTIAEIIEPNVGARAHEGQASAISAIVEGLTHSNRFAPPEAFARAVLMYAQLQALHNRFVQFGWEVDRAITLEAIVDSWTVLGRSKTQH